MSLLNNSAKVLFGPTIHAELSEYRFKLFAHRSKNDSILVVLPSQVLCGDVYVFYGQSNALGSGTTTDLYGIVSDKFIWSYRYSPSDSGQPSYWSMGHYGAQSIGLFAMSFANEIVEKNEFTVAIINAAQDGLAISELNDRNDSDIYDPSRFFGLMLSRIQRSKIDSIKSLIWLQGENESGSTAHTTAKYPSRLQSLYNNLFIDIPFLESFTMVQLNVLGPLPYFWEAGELRYIQRRYSDVFPKSYFLATAGIAENDGVHYTKEGYVTLGKHLHILANDKFYHNSDSISTTAPNIQKVINQPSRERLKLVFDSNQRFNFDTLINYGYYTRKIKDYIFNGQLNGFVDSVR